MRRIGIASFALILLIVSSTSGMPVRMDAAFGAPTPAVYDDFNDNAIDNSKWSAFTVGSSAVGEINQRLEVFQPSTASGPLFQAGYESTCRLQGDFDIQVDYELLQWPASNGVRVGLFVPSGTGLAVERASAGGADVSFPPELYLTHIDSAFQVLATSDTSGTLRLVRSGSTLTGYSSSIAIGSGPISTADVHFAIATWSHDAMFADKDVKVAFDNLLINNGTLDCSASPTSPPIVIDGSGLTLTHTLVNGSPGDQFDPHVSGDWVSYTSDFAIRYFNFATNIDSQIPMGSSARDILSDVSGSKIVFSRIIAGDRTAVMVFDASTPSLAPIEIDAASGTNRLGTAIGGNTVAYIDYGLGTRSELVIHDLMTNTSTRITNDGAFDDTPSVSPDGNTVVWAHCPSSLSQCDIWKAVKSGGSWVTSQVSNLGVSYNSDTDGDMIVYDSYRVPAYSIFMRPAAGGAEVQIPASGFLFEPSISKNLVSYEGLATLFDPADLYVYDIIADHVYRITNSPDVTEQLNDIDVLSDRTVHLVWSSDEDGFDQRNIHAVTFKISMPDTIPPAVTMTPSRSPDSNGYYNHPVTFTVTGDDSATGASNPVTCDAPITYSGPDGSNVPITGHCTDNAANIGTATVTITYDATPPSITPPPNVTKISATALAVSLGSPSVIDNIDASPIITNNAPSLFPIGVTLVTWTATDHAGNSATAIQQVTIKTPGQSINDLIALGNSFGAQTNVLGNAQKLLNDNNPNNDNGACGKLDAFINQVNANNNLSASEKSQLEQLANAIRVSIGC